MVSPLRRWFPRPAVGWLGPHVYYALLRAARRGRVVWYRASYVLALLVALGAIWAAVPWEPVRLNDFAAAAERFAVPLLILQNLLVLLLAPITFGTALTEERERRTLDLVLVTHVGDRELVLGKLLSCWVNLASVVLAGLPVLAVVHLWGGVDLGYLAFHFACTLLLALSAGAACLALSTQCRRSVEAALAGYGVMFYFGMLAVSRQMTAYGDYGLSGPGQTTWWSVLGTAALANLGVAWAACSVATSRVRAWRVGDETGQGARPPAAGRGSAKLPPPRPVPPVADNALAWKECYRTTPWWTSFIVEPRALVGLALAAVVLGALAYRGLHWLAANDRGLRVIDGLFLITSLLVYTTVLGFAAGVTLNAAGSVARERELRTLDFLLTLPGGRRELLFYKWLAGYYQCWPLYALSVPPVVFAAGAGLLPLWAGVVLLLAPWPVILFLNALALYLSVRVAAVLTANVVVAVTVAGWVGAHLFLWANYAGFARLAGELAGDSDPLVLLGIGEASACVLLAGVLAVLAVRHFDRDGADVPGPAR